MDKYDVQTFLFYFVALSFVAIGIIAAIVLFVVALRWSLSVAV